MLSRYQRKRRPAVFAIQDAMLFRNVQKKAQEELTLTSVHIYIRSSFSRMFLESLRVFNNFSLATCATAAIWCGRKMNYKRNRGTLTSPLGMRLSRLCMYKFVHVTNTSHAQPNNRVTRLTEKKVFYCNKK